jgi:hypothetical protein
MYVLGSGKTSTGYEPISTKWGGISTMSGLLPGGGLRGGMSFFRPNQAMARGFYPGGGLGQLAVDPTLLGLGIAALAAGMFLFGIKKGPGIRRRKASRLRKRHAALGRRISLLEA